MANQVEIHHPIELLDPRGHITTEGWARQPYWNYRREAIRAPKWRIKEWDYFSVLSPRQNFGLTLTMSDLGYLGVFAICFLDFERRYFHQIDTFSLFPMGKTGLLEEKMQFAPLLDRKANINLALAKSVQHQVFGHFTGPVVLDDGRPVAIDRVLGFAEDVLNWW